MIPILSVSDMRNSDAACIRDTTPAAELMRRAGEAVFRNVTWHAPVGIVCGAGNNAGDGFVLALLLSDAGIVCDIILLDHRFSPEGRVYFDRCVEKGIPVLHWKTGQTLSHYATLADCIWGTGFRGVPEGAGREAIEAINASEAFVVSVDINSGLGGDNGWGELCVRSDVTVSLGFFQPGHFLNLAKDVMKSVINCDIGIPAVGKTRFLLESADVRGMIPPRPNFSHKGTYGYSALIGGSDRYSGAIRLAAMSGAAMRSGAGVMKVAVPSFLRDPLIPLLLESTLYPLSDAKGCIRFVEEEIREVTSHTRSVAFGMGCRISDEGTKVLQWLLHKYTERLIIDADGLNMLSSLPRDEWGHSPATVILTPHPMEFSRLSGLSVDVIRQNPIPAAEEFAAESHCILLLKGPTTVITDGHTTYLTDTGCPGMATAGSGDVLSGILAAFLASFPDPLKAAAAAAWINGRAGMLAEQKVGAVSMIAGDTVSAIPEVLRMLSQENC